MSNTTRIVKRPGRTKTLPFPFDPSDLDEANVLVKAQVEAEQAAVAAEKAGADEATGLRAKADGADTAMHAFIDAMPKIVFHLRSIGPKAVEKMMAKPAHQPTAEQLAEHEAEKRPGKLQYNPDTFEPAIIAASTAKLEQPGTDALTSLSADDIIELFSADGWSDTDKATVFAECINLANAGTLLRRDLVGHLGKG